MLRFRSIHASVLSLSVGLLCLLLIAPVPGIADADIEVATVNGISIFKAEAEQAYQQYLIRTGKKSINAEEKQEIVRSIIRRHLILELPEVQAYKKDKSVIAQVQQFENGLVIKKYLENKVGPSVKIEEEAIKEYYNNNLSQFVMQPKVEASHILSRNREEAEKVFKMLTGGGDFTELAKQFSIDLPMAKEGGSMGTIEKGKSLPELERVLFTLKEGAHSDIIETPYGYHILMVNKIHTASYRPYEEVKGDIQKHLIRKNEAEAFNKMASELEKGSDAKIYAEKL